MVETNLVLYFIPLKIGGELVTLQIEPSDGFLR